jgi:hypothetical protein
MGFEMWGLKYWPQFKAGQTGFFTRMKPSVGSQTQLAPREYAAAANYQA